MPKLTIYSGNASSPNSGASSSKIIEDIIAIRNDKKLTDAIAGLSKHFDGDRDFSTLRNTLLATVTKSVFRYPPAIKVVGKPDIENAVKTITSKQESEDIKHSRLFHFTANGGKARIIANVD